MPLIVLTADRPPELRGIGAGQTIDQLKLYGSAVRWFCEVGTHDADDAGLLHFRSVACRAFAAAARRPAPGPGAPQRRLARAAGARAARRATSRRPRRWRSRAAARPAADRRAARRRRRRPTELRRGARRAARGRTARGLIVAGRQPDPALRPAIAALAAASGYPILAEPTSQLRLGAPRPRRWSSAPTTRSPARARRRSSPELVLRFGDMPTSQAAAPVARGLDGCPSWSSIRCTAGTSRPRTPDAIVRADPAALARGLASGWTPARPTRPGSAAWLRRPTRARRRGDRAPS